MHPFPVFARGSAHGFRRRFLHRPGCACADTSHGVSLGLQWHAAGGCRAWAGVQPAHCAVSHIHRISGTGPRRCRTHQPPPLRRRQAYGRTLCAVPWCGASDVVRRYAARTSCAMSGVCRAGVMCVAAVHRWMIQSSKRLGARARGAMTPCLCLGFRLAASGYTPPLHPRPRHWRACGVHRTPASDRYTPHSACTCPLTAPDPHAEVVVLYNSARM